MTYQEKLALLQPVCKNKSLLTTLERGAGAYNSGKLYYELRKAGLSPDAVVQETPAPGVITQTELEEAQTELEETPAELEKIKK